jgi:hypothetical protein
MAEQLKGMGLKRVDGLNTNKMNGHEKEQAY